MKKILRKTLSMLLAVSALCILFAFPASAVTYSCPCCHTEFVNWDVYPAYTTCYVSLGDVSVNNTPDYHHEVYCPNCDWATEESCQDTEIVNHDCTYDWACVCGQVIPDSGSFDHQYSIIIEGEYNSNGHRKFCGYYYAECTCYIIEPHHIGALGYCTDGCGYHQ